MSSPPAKTLTMGPGPVRSWFRAIIDGTGCEVVEDVADADGLVWFQNHTPEGLREVLDAAPRVEWVQLPAAGVEQIVDEGLCRDGRTWTAAQGVFGEPVAEHALALLLAGLRDLDERAKATTWGERSGKSLFDGNVVILGAGGIAESLTRLLAPFRVEITVVRRRAQTGTQGVRTVGREQLGDVLPEADAVVVALSLTPDTVGIVGEPELRAMKDDAWLINVARGKHVDTDALLTALHEGWIGGAALDVTDPEPLPDGHPLWSAPRCIITPHTANTDAMAIPYLTARVAENARRFANGEPLLGVVDVDAGY